MAPSSAAKAQSINNLQKVEQRKMKKTKTKMKKKQESSSKTHHHHHHLELSGLDDHNLRKEEEEDDNIYSSDDGGCCTPKADRFKIPGILSCPPAPKKTRVFQNFSSTRSPIAFFSSPDIDSFFSSLRNISD